MERRNAIQLTATLFGGTIIGADVFLAGCRDTGPVGTPFSESDIALLDNIGEAILPETADSPGARAAEIGKFMEVIVSDCYSEEEQRIFIDGLRKIRQLTRELHNSRFSDLSPEQQIGFLNKLDQEARSGPDGSPHYFQMMKQLTIWGYFTSEPGATRALRYNPLPGRYVGCIPYQAGDKAWAE